MAERLLNIEIGDHLSKICLIIKRGKSIQLEQSFLFETPAGAVNDGWITDSKAVAELLRTELQKNKLSGAKSVVFSVASGRIATREVTLPPIREKRIQTLVETNAAEYFPVDMSGYQVTYTVLERLEGEPPGLRLQVMAAPTTLVESYIALADACGLKVQQVDYSGNSQYQALRMVESKGTALYVNVETANTYCNFVVNGTLKLQRSFAFGGSDLISAYQSATGHKEEGYLDALNRLSQAEEGPISREETGDILERLISSIVRSVNFFGSMRTSEQTEGIQRIVLTGACARIAHLRELIAENTGIETDYLSELPGILVRGEHDVSAYLCCIGSAVAPVDFLPAEYKDRHRLGGKRTKKEGSSLSGGILICAVGVAASLVLCGVSLLGYLMTLQDLKATERRIAELAPAQAVYETYVKYSAAAEGLQVMQGAARGHNAQLRAFFEELEVKMPASILLLNAVGTSEGVSMEIVVPSLTEAAVAIHELRSFQSIEVIAVGEISEEPSELGVVQAQFTVSCFYPEPEPEPAEDEQITEEEEAAS